MLIGERLREIRELKKLSQGDMEHRTGLLRCYTSRVENGHTVPSLGTLEKYARALEVPIYRLFYEGEKPPKLPRFPTGKAGKSAEWGSSGRDAHMLGLFCRHFSKMKESDTKLLLTMAQRMAGRSRRPK